ncbi:MAG: S-layer homology domain-containing protein [Clostridia bacterium]|nr:S-layer homology domain-containing protein [Clostridia bacterium]
MKQKLSCILILCLLIGTLAVLPAAAYVRISYGADHLAEQAELIKTALRGDTFSFSETDFKQALGVTKIDNVTILSLPPATDGVLKLNGNPVVGGQIISRGEIAKLTFTPANDGMESTTFQFCANTPSGTTALTCTLRTAERVNYAPTVATLTEASLSVHTQKEIGVYGQMKAEDPEGDALTYLVIAYPQKGSLTVLDSGSGEFRYAPQAGMTGNDSFSYVARDAYGNYSAIATMNITVSARKSSLVYADMQNHAAYNAALVMAENNIMLGSLEGDNMYFHPGKEVSRGEFLVMAMKSAGIQPAAGVEKTWFDDDAAIPETIKKYVATAQLYGYVNGSFDGKGLYFNADKSITRAEAAVILNNILDVATPTVLPTVADASDIPGWARDAIYALYDAEIFTVTEDGAMAANATMTRADTAAALYALMQYEG